MKRSQDWQNVAKTRVSLYDVPESHALFRILNILTTSVPGLCNYRIFYHLLVLAGKCGARSFVVGVEGCVLEVEGCVLGAEGCVLGVKR